MNKLSLLSIILPAFTSCQTEAVEEQNPNVLLIVADDLGWRDLAVSGSPFYETPHLDALASEGVLFTQAYTASPVCSPTRASILTGKNPVRTGITAYIGYPQPDKVQTHWTRNKPLLPAPYKPYLDTEEITLAEALKQQGYATFFAGKWHLGSEEYYPEKHGFDINIGGWDTGGPYTGNKYFSPYDNPKMENGPDGELLPLRLSNETADFIEMNKDNPFFAMLSFYSVHTPLMTTPELEEKYTNKKQQMGLEDEWGKEGDRKNRQTQCHAVYAGMVESMDQGVGIIVNRLKELDLFDNTVILFISDNGGLSTSEGHPTSNLPLRAGKGWLYEGGIRVPIIMAGKGVDLKGETVDEIITSMDVYPTLLELTQHDLMPEQHVDGSSIAGLINEKYSIPDRDTFFWHNPHYGNQGDSPGSAIRKGDWKLIYHYETQKAQLFNMKHDLSERYDLISQHPELGRDLQDELMSWLDETGALFPTENPNAEE
ncbi:MAG: sulfatase [Bacteroidales bacterium]